VSQEGSLFLYGREIKLGTCDTKVKMEIDTWHFSPFIEVFEVENLEESSLVYLVKWI